MARSHGPSMEFSVLGPLRVVGSDGPVEIPGTKERLLLAHLIARAGRAVGTTELIDGLWGDDPPRSAGKALQNCVMRLRNALEPDRAGTPAVLVTEGQGYRLMVESRRIDAERFARLLAAAERGTPQERLHVLREALEMWRGLAYAGQMESAVLAAEATRLEELRLSAVEDRCAVELDFGGSRLVVAELEGLVAQHPLRERLWGLLILGLYREGRQGEALGAYERARTVLAEELGVDPGQQLRELQARVLAQDTALGGPEAAGMMPAALQASVAAVHGRDQEQAALRSAWHRASAGEPQVVHVRGPVGAGARTLAALLAQEVTVERRTVQYVGRGGADPEPFREAPDLLVVDRVPPLAVAGRLTLVIAGPDAEPDSRWTEPSTTTATVLDLGPLDRSAVRALVAGYVTGSDLEAATDQVLAESGGWPGRAHAAAMGYVRATATVAVRAAASETGELRSTLADARSRLTEGVLELQQVDRFEGADLNACPWPGLAAYDVADSPWFAGRERLVAELLARVAGASCVAVVGASGSGKSSAVRAGLVAGLADDQLPGSAGWDVVVIRPGPHPLRTLATQVLARRHDAGAILEQLIRSPEASDQRTVLVVDQFEETWTACLDERERAAFLEMLTEVATDVDGRSVVVLVLRADFLDRLADRDTLAALAADNTVLVGAPNPDDVRRAVERPARRGGLVFDDGLVDAVVADAGAEPGLLPLLSTAMAQLWDARSGRRLTFAAYVRLGGISSAIWHLAEQTWSELDEARQDVARTLLLRLTGPGEGSSVTRRRVPLAELAGLQRADAGAVVERLVQARLLTLSDGHVEVSHEALFREWPRMQGWLAEDAAGRAVQQRLAIAAEEWSADGHDPALLWRGARLESGLEIAAAMPEELTRNEQEFLGAGREASEEARRNAERRAEEKTRQNRRLRGLLLGAAVLLVVAVVAGILALVARGNATDAARDADAEAVAADAKRLAASALSVEYPDLALLTAVEATHLEESPETYGALLTLLSRQPDVVTRYRTPERFLYNAAAPDGRTVFVGENSNVVYALDAKTGDQLWVQRSLEEQVVGIDVSPDGETLAVPIVSEDNQVVLLDGADGREVGRFGLGEVAEQVGPDFVPTIWNSSVTWTSNRELVVATVSHVVIVDRTGAVRRSVPWPEPMPFSDTFLVWPDGATVSTGSEFGGPGLVVDLDEKEPVFRELPGAVRAVSPDGSRIAVVRSRDHRLDLRVHDAESLAPRSQSWPLGEGLLTEASWSPDGRHLAVALDEEVLLRDPRTGAPVRTLVGHSGAVMSVAWAGQDDELLWTAGRDGTAVAFDVTERRGTISAAPTRNAPHSGEGNPESGAAIWTDYQDFDLNSAFLRGPDEVDGRKLTFPRGIENCGCQAASTELTPDGRLAIVGAQVYSEEVGGASQDAGLVFVWNTATRTVEKVVETPWPVYGLATTPDGRRVVLNGAKGWGELDLATYRVTVAAGLPEMGPYYDANEYAEASPDGSRAILIRDQATLVVDLGADEVVLEKELPYGIVSAAWTRDGRRVAVGSDSGHLYVLDGDSLEPVEPQRLVTGGFVTDVEISPDGLTAATIGSDGDVTVWDARSWRPYGLPVVDDDLGNGFLSFDADSTTLSVDFEVGRHVEIDVRPEAWATAACTAANRELTANEAAIIDSGRAAGTTCSG